MSALQHKVVELKHNHSEHDTILRDGKFNIFLFIVKIKFRKTFLELGFYLLKNGKLIRFLRIILFAFLATF